MNDNDNKFSEFDEGYHRAYIENANHIYEIQRINNQLVETLQAIRDQIDAALNANLRTTSREFYQKLQRQHNTNTTNHSS